MPPASMCCCMSFPIDPFISKNMAQKGTSISNKKTGERITWLATASDTQGIRLEFEFEVAPGGHLPVVHFHPRQQETFVLQEGEFEVMLKSGSVMLKPGDQLTIPKGVQHQWWNPSATVPAKMKVTFEPALNTETFLEQFYGLGNDDKTKPDGTPKFLQIMAMANTYEIYVAGPPLAIQKLLSAVLGGFSRLIGYKKFYPEYSR